MKLFMSRLLFLFVFLGNSASLFAASMSANEVMIETSSELKKFECVLFHGLAISPNMGVPKQTFKVDVSASSDKEALKKISLMFPPKYVEPNKWGTYAEFAGHKGFFRSENGWNYFYLAARCE